MDMGVKLSSKDVAKHLGIEPVTVRKYASMLEEQGYSFNKDSKGWRLYTEDDVKTLEYLCTMTKINGHSLDETVKHIASLYRSKLSISNTATSLQDNPLIEFMKRQEEFNHSMMERMEAFERRQSERHDLLTKALRESLETQKMIAATKQKSGGNFGKATDCHNSHRSNSLSLYLLASLGIPAVRKNDAANFRIFGNFSLAH